MRDSLRRSPLWTCPKCGAKLVTRNLWHSCGFVRFASITKLSQAGMDRNFALPKPLKSTRVVKLEEVVPGWWVHRLRVIAPRELDSEVQGWLRESYRLMA